MGNTYDLKGRTAVVTGGAKGIGRAVVALLRASGVQVCVWDRSDAAIDGVVAERIDIKSPAAIGAALERTLGHLARIDILVNVAGYLGYSQPFVEHAPADWHRIVAVNLVGTMQVTQAVLPHMIRAGRGCIVNFASLAGKEGVPGITAYSGASGGVISFTKALSREVVQHGVRVNCVAPGPIDTDMIRDLGAEVVAKMVADSPMQRLGRPEEVAELVAWLASDASAFSTGAVFDVSGGRARY
jgi:NAD(P)-dependent dehydrogenase (short-subunit alcohol dehydrogenase family)